MATAVILVGGPNKGTRFRPLSLDLPKPLFPIAGKPMIYHHIEACAQLKMHEVLLIGFFPESQFTTFMEQTSKELKIRIRYLNEEQILGTAGGLYFFRKEILRSNPVHIVVLHADICCAFPLQELVDFHKGHGQLCTIMGTKVPQDYANHYGCLVKDENTHALLHYAEKPETFVSDLINCGVYCFSPAFFDNMGSTIQNLQKHQENLRLSQYITVESDSEIARQCFRLEQDVFVPMAGTKQLYVYEYKGFWRQIKNAGASVYCNDMYTKHYAVIKPELLAKQSNRIIGHVIIHPTAQIDPTAVIGPNVTIGEGVKIGKGVRLLHSIILDSAEVMDQSFVSYSILAWGASVGKWARVEGIPNYTPFLYHNEKRQGVTIVGREAQVKSELIVRNCIVMPHKALEQSHYNEILL